MAWFFDGIVGETAANEQDLRAALALAGRISRLPKRERRIVAHLLDELERP